MQTILTSMNDSELRNLLSETVREAVKLELKNQTSQDQSTTKEFLTRKEVAELLNVSLTTLNDWNKAKLLQGSKIGTTVRYRYSDVQEALSKRAGRRTG